MKENDVNETAEKMKRERYEKELRKLQTELCRLQEWVKHKGLRAIVVFEGRDAAGKGGTIKAITERVSPRVFRLVALPAPSDREKYPWYAAWDLQGEGDKEWLKSCFQTLLLNFTWWVNRKDRSGRNVFEGGFLGLDNIGVFDGKLRAEHPEKLR